MCVCDTYECISIIGGGYCDPIITDIIASVTGEWLMRYEFNGKWFNQNINVEAGENVLLPLVFNENYTHAIQFLDDGVLVNDTCYKLDKRDAVMSITIIGNPTDYPVMEFIYLIPTDQPAGTVLTDSRFIGKTISGVSVATQLYGPNFFTVVGDTLTMNPDIYTFSNGDIVVVQYKTTVV